MVLVCYRSIKLERKRSRGHSVKPRRANNNQVKYEALLAGKKLAGELGAQILTTISNFKLITGQVNGDYQTRDPN
ncbi:hypothetical protein CR513_42435, partial [Mucuna pruriens]